MFCMFVRQNWMFVSNSQFYKLTNILLYLEDELSPFQLKDFVLIVLLASLHQVRCYCVSRCLWEFETCSWYLLICIKDLECAHQWGMIVDSSVSFLTDNKLRSISYFWHEGVFFFFPVTYFWLHVFYFVMSYFHLQFEENFYIIFWEYNFWVFVGWISTSLLFQLFNDFDFVLRVHYNVLWIFNVLEANWKWMTVHVCEEYCFILQN